MIKVIHSTKEIEKYGLCDGLITIAKDIRTVMIDGVEIVDKVLVHSPVIGCDIWVPGYCFEDKNKNKRYIYK